ncbi:hypothetical protein HY500_00600 [Candidatus Woesearchaeota archaeon]|nr:hypothetical protein [Candidatus Woesearchaeota archaeon]
MATSNIYLVENDIHHWETPLPKGTIRYRPLIDLSRTELISPLGMESVREKGSRYMVEASAAIYLARILRRGSSKQGEELLFEGNIGIYQIGTIPGTELYGYYLRKERKIWLARPNTPRFREKSELHRSGLCRVIFGEATTERGRDERVRAIIRGYEVTPEETKRISLEERKHGNFGRLPEDVM